jgi:hypothetical protein
METVFQPDFAGLDKGIWIATFTAIISLIILLWLKFGKNIDRRIKPLAQLLMGFSSVISLGVIVFSLLATKKLTEVIIRETSIELLSRSLTYEEIKRVYIQIDQPGAGLFQVNANTGTHYLIIEPVEGINIILSEVNYPIFEIKETISKYLASNEK